jgi:hypothetical protein
VNRACRVLGTVAMLGSFTGPLLAQEIRLSESPRSEAQEALADFLNRGGYEVWVRDTVLARGDTVRAHVLVLEGAARIAGRVEGDLYVVDGDLFMRTGGSVSGELVVIGGGYYASDLAEVEGDLTYRPSERLRVLPEAGGFVIIPVERVPSAFELDGQYGFQSPVYQRVDAVTLGWGALARATGMAGSPDLEFDVRYKTGPGELEGSVRNSWYPTDRLRLGLAASRATRSMDEWIRPTWYNSLAVLFAGEDMRNYYRADRAGVEIEWSSVETAKWRSEARWSLSLAAGWEDASNLTARDVVALFASDSARDNPVVDPGDAYTLHLGFRWSREEGDARTAFGLGLEGASRDVGGDFSYLLGEARAVVRRPLPWGHRVDLFAIGRADLSGTLPGQRWSSIGGVGTLPTIPILSVRGERLLYGEVTYAVPLFAAASFGGADVFLRGSAGAAWSEGESFDLEENLAVGLSARVLGLALEAALAGGPGVGEDDVDVEVFFDVRLQRPVRSTSTPRPSRRF